MTLYEHFKFLGIAISDFAKEFEYSYMYVFYVLKGKKNNKKIKKSANQLLEKRKTELREYLNQSNI